MNHALDPVAAVAQLRGRGVEPIDPIRLHFLETLARRTQVQEGAVKRLLEDKLSKALAVYQKRLGQAKQSTQQLPSPPPLSALAALTRTLTHHLPKNVQANAQEVGDERGGEDAASLGAQPELKSLRYFRDTWSTLSVDRQLAQAIAQGPENAGPLNSHQLVLRSLAAMRDISPDYLKRFMSYADALLWLDQVDSQPVAKSPSDGEGVKKRKASGVRSR